MSRTVQIDFIGMCVLLWRASKEASVGLLSEYSHLHLLTFRQKDGNGAPVTTLRILRPGRYWLAESTDKPIRPGPVEIEDTNDLLPELGKLAIAFPKCEEKLNAALRSRLTLPEGKFETRPPANNNAKGPWLFTPREGHPVERNLTDRSSFTMSTDLEHVLLMRHDAVKNKDVEVAWLEPDETGRIHATVQVIDDDLQGRSPEVTNGFVLGEFQLLYGVLDHFGPVPVFVGNPANPDDATCPQGQVNLDV